MGALKLDFMIVLEQNFPRNATPGKSVAPDSIRPVITDYVQIRKNFGAYELNPPRYRGPTKKTTSATFDEFTVEL